MINVASITRFGVSMEQNYRYLYVMVFNNSPPGGDIYPWSLSRMHSCIENISDKIFLGVSHIYTDDDSIRDEI